MIKVGLFLPELAQSQAITECVTKYSHQNGICIKLEKYRTVGAVEQDRDIDACFIDFNTYCNIKDKIQFTNHIIKFIIVIKNSEDIIKTIQLFPEEYCMVLPIQQFSCDKILDNIRKRARQRAIIAKLGHDNSMRIYIKNLNYINIEGRNMVFHTQEAQKKIVGPILRQSFRKEIEIYLTNNPELYLASPGILVNLVNIKSICMNRIEFIDGEVLFFPKSSYDKLKEAWRSYFIR